MKKSLIALALAGAFSAPTFAQTAAPAAEAAPASDHTFTGNAGLFSEYRFRGIAQTFAKPAFQGGFDYSHSSGFYVGNWNSNVSSGAGFAEGNLEMDFYGGYKMAVGSNLTLDFGFDDATGTFRRWTLSDTERKAYQHADQRNAEGNLQRTTQH